MGAKIQAFDIFQTPLSSHYPLPLSRLCDLFYVQITKSQQSWVQKSQIHKVSHVPKVPKFDKLFMSANLMICDFQNLLADRRPLSLPQSYQSVIIKLVP